MLSLIVFGIDTKLLVAVVSVFFFFGFSGSACRDRDLQKQQDNRKYLHVPIMIMQAMIVDRKTMKCDPKKAKIG